MPSDKTFIPNQLYLIPLNDLLPDPDQPRKYIDPVADAEIVQYHGPGPDENLPCGSTSPASGRQRDVRHCYGGLEAEHRNKNRRGDPGDAGRGKRFRKPSKTGVKTEDAV